MGYEKYAVVQLGGRMEIPRPGKASLIGLSGKTFTAGSPVTFSWNATANSTHYNLWIDKADSSGTYSYYNHIREIKGTSWSLTLSAGSYRARVNAYNSNYSEDSDWVHTTGDFVYFTVKDATYTVSFDPNGGIGGPLDRTQTIGTPMTLSSTVPSRADTTAGYYNITLDANGGEVNPASLSAKRTTSYSFKCWNKYPNGSGPDYYPTYSYDFGETCSLYAQWNSSTATQSVSLPTPTRYGYDFKGWATSSTASSGFTGSYTPGGNVTLYAVWERSVVASGTWGQLHWELDAFGVLGIVPLDESGTLYAMNDFSSGSNSAWLAYKDQIEIVGFARGVGTVGANAFSGCTNLRLAIVQDGITSIGNRAFYGCTTLEDLWLPKELTSIGSEAFGACSSLTEFHYGSSPYAWRQVSKESGNEPLLNATIHYGGGYSDYMSGTWGNLSWEAADGSYNFAYLIVSGSGAMSDFNPDAAQAWRTSSLMNNVTDLDIGDDITSIGNNAFRDFHKLKYIYALKNIQTIGAQAFYGCVSLPEITLPDTVTSIQAGAFYGCQSLSSVTIPASVTEIASAAFCRCENLKDVYYGGTQAQWDAMTIGPLNNPLTEATLHLIEHTVTFNANGGSSPVSSVTRADGAAIGELPIPVLVDTNEATKDLKDFFLFDGWYTDSLFGLAGGTKVSAETPVTGDMTLYAKWVKNSAYQELSFDPNGGSFERLENEPDKTYYYNDYGFILYGPYKNRQAYLAANKYVIDGGRVGELPVPTREGCTFKRWYHKLDEGGTVFIYPNSSYITSDGTQFTAEWIVASGTWGGLSWELSDRGTLYLIGEAPMPDFEPDSTEAWRPWKDSITSVSFLGNNAIPLHSCTSIGAYAFAECTKLKSISLWDAECVREGAFMNCSALEIFYTASTCVSIEDNALAGCTALRYVSLSKSLEHIGEGVFMGCSSLEIIFLDSENTCYCLADGVLFDIDMEELIVCPATKTGDYEIPDGVERIAASAFYGCDKLENISFPDTLEEIGDAAFWNSRITSAILPDSVTALGESVFSLCFYLREVRIPSGLHSIPAGSFTGDESLRTVTIPKSVTHVGQNAFANCVNLTVEYGGSQQHWNAIDIESGNDALLQATVHCAFVIPKPDFILPIALTEIEEEAFQGGAFTCVLIQNEVTAIGRRAFAECPNLRYVYIPNAAKQIASDAFWGDTNLTILGTEGSAAQDFAYRSGYEFIPVA